MQLALQEAGVAFCTQDLCELTCRLEQVLQRPPCPQRALHGSCLHLASVLVNTSVAVTHWDPADAAGAVRIGHLVATMEECSRQVPTAALHHAETEAEPLTVEAVIASLQDVFRLTPARPTGYACACVLGVLRFGWGALLHAMAQARLGCHAMAHKTPQGVGDFLRTTVKRKRHGARQLCVVHAFDARSQARELGARFAAPRKPGSDEGAHVESSVALAPHVLSIEQAVSSEGAGRELVAAHAQALEAAAAPRAHTAEGAVMKATANILPRRAASAVHDLDVSDLDILAPGGMMGQPIARSLQCGPQGTLSAALEMAIANVQGMESSTFNLMPVAATAPVGTQDSSSDSSTTTMDSDSDRYSESGRAPDTAGRAAWRELGYLQALPRSRADSVLPTPVMRRAAMTQDSSDGDSDSENGAARVPAGSPASARRLPPAIALLQRSMQQGLLLHGPLHTPALDGQQGQLGDAADERPRADSLDDIAGRLARRAAAAAAAAATTQQLALEGLQTDSASEASESSRDMSLASQLSVTSTGSSQDHVPFGAEEVAWSASTGSPHRAFLPVSLSPAQASPASTFHEAAFQSLESRVEVHRAVQRGDLTRSNTVAAGSGNLHVAADARGFWVDKDNTAQLMEQLSTNELHTSPAVRDTLLQLASGGRLAAGGGLTPPRGHIYGSSPGAKERDVPVAADAMAHGRPQRQQSGRSKQQVAVSAQQVASQQALATRQQEADNRTVDSEIATPTQQLRVRGDSVPSVPSPEAAFWVAAQKRQSAKVQSREVEARATAAKVAIALMAHSLDGDAVGPQDSAASSAAAVLQARRMLFQATEAARTGSHELCLLLEERVPQLSQIWPLLLPVSAAPPPSAHASMQASMAPPPSTGLVNTPAKAFASSPPARPAAGQVTSGGSTVSLRSSARPGLQQTPQLSSQSQLPTPRKRTAGGQASRAASHLPSRRVAGTRGQAGRTRAPPQSQEGSPAQSGKSGDSRSASLPRGHFSGVHSAGKTPRGAASSGVFSRLASADTKASASRQRSIAQQAAAREQRRLVAREDAQRAQKGKSTSAAAMQRLHSGQSASASAQIPGQSEPDQVGVKTKTAWQTVLGDVDANKTPGPASPAAPKAKSASSETKPGPASPAAPKAKSASYALPAKRRASQPRVGAAHKYLQSSPADTPAMAVTTAGRSAVRHRLPPAQRQPQSPLADSTVAPADRHSNTTQPALPVGTTAVYEGQDGELHPAPSGVAPWVVESGAVGAVSYSPAGHTVTADDDDNDLVLLELAGKANWDVEPPTGESPSAPGSPPDVPGPADSPPPLPEEQLASAAKRLDFLNTYSGTVASNRPQGSSPPPAPAAPAVKGFSPLPAPAQPTSSSGSSAPIAGTADEEDTMASVRAAVECITRCSALQGELGQKLSAAGSLPQTSPQQPQHAGAELADDKSQTENVQENSDSESESGSREGGQSDGEGGQSDAVHVAGTSSPMKSVTALLSEIRRDIHAASSTKPLSSTQSPEAGQSPPSHVAQVSAPEAHTGQLLEAGEAGEAALHFNTASSNTSPQQHPGSPTRSRVASPDLLPSVFLSPSLMWPPPHSSTPGAYVAKASSSASSYLYHRSTGFYYHPKKQLYVSPAGFGGQPRTFFRFDSRGAGFVLARKKRRAPAASGRGQAAEDDAVVRQQFLANLQRLKSLTNTSHPRATPALAAEVPLDEDAGAAWLQSRMEKRRGQLQEVSSRVLAAALME